MTVDSHMRVGEFPLFNVQMDRDGLAATFSRFDLAAGMVFCPDNSLTRHAVETIVPAYGLYWANPRVPGYLDETVEYLRHPPFAEVPALED